MPQLVQYSGSGAWAIGNLIELPETADLLNQLKARRKKSRADLGDVAKILEFLGGEDR